MFFVVPSIFMDCYMGSWSDKFGRKLTLGLPPTGAFLSTIVYAVMGTSLLNLFLYTVARLFLCSL